MTRRFLIAGSSGLVGSALVRALEKRDEEVIKVDRRVVDLRDKDETLAFFSNTRPSVVICAAARVGGILDNAQHPVDFIDDNLAIQGNVFLASHLTSVKKLIFLGSSCIYPRNAIQPIKEQYLMTGPLEETNKAYAVAKIVGLVSVDSYRKQYGHDWISVMPTNLYGPNDNFNLKTAHVIPALINKMIEAKAEGRAEVEVWGEGDALREFMHVDDLADAILHVESRYSGEDFINLGSGDEITIRELAKLIANLVGFEGHLKLNPSYPSGTPRKLLDSSKLTELGWKPRIQLKDGLRDTIDWYQKNVSIARM